LSTEVAVPTRAVPTVYLSRASFLRRAGDFLTLAGAVVAPSYGKGIGGINGLPYADIILGLAALTRIVQALTEGLPRAGLRLRSVLLSVLAVFACAGLLSSIVNHESLSWSFIRIVIATAGTVLLVSAYGDGTDPRPVLKAFALGTAVLAVSSFTGYKLHGRSFGWSRHPNQLGHSCMIGIFAAGWLYDNTRDPRIRRLWVGLILLDLVAINRSGSRGALIGLAAGGFVYLWLRGNIRLRVVAIAGVWALTLVLATQLVVLPESNPLGRFLTSKKSNTSASASDQQRESLLSASWDKISADPIFGTGFKNVDLGNGFTGIDQVHVVYLQGWIGAGAVGGFVLMLIGGMLVVVPFTQRKHNLALACGGVAIAAAWGFTNLLTVRDQWIYIAAIFATVPALPLRASVRSAVRM